MAGKSSKSFWWGLGGLTALLVVGQVVWMMLAWNADDEEMARPPAALKSPDGEGRDHVGGSRRRIYDAFPPLVRFEVDPVEQVGSSILDDESVLGVDVEGESRAYPLNMLGHPGSEVVNDTLGGLAIAVTFCGLCETPLVFSRRVDEKVLTFYVSGVVVDSNMLLKDAETRSGWVQLLGKAVDGPLKGKRLEKLASVWTDWKTWRLGHPGTTAIKLSRGTKKYSPDAPGSGDPKKRAFLEALQWGLEGGGQAKPRSWPFAGLARCRVVNDTFDGRPLLIVFEPDRPSPVGFDRRLEGQTLSFRLQGEDLVDESTGSTWDPATGRATLGPLEGRRLAPVPGIIAATAIWRTFHPDGESWTPDRP